MLFFVLHGNRKIPSFGELLSMFKLLQIRPEIVMLRVTDIIRPRFLQADFRRYFVKILENPQRIFCVLCLVSSKILTVKNLRPEDEVFLLDFWG